MVSFKTMERTGEIKRTSSSKIRYEDIHIEPGFNLGGRNEEDDDNDIALLDHIKQGGMLPDLEVRPRDAGGAWIVDGHRRYKLIGAADRAGVPMRDRAGELWVSVVQFVGNDVDRTVRLMTSNANKKLTQLQIAEGYLRLTKFGKTPDEIAALFLKTRSHVDQLLILAAANNDVHNFVSEGNISATAAVEMVREYGEKAGAIISSVLEDKDGNKVTIRELPIKKPWVPSTKQIAPVLAALERFINGISFEERLAIDGIGDAVQSKTALVPCDLLRILIHSAHDLREAGYAAEDKHHAKAKSSEGIDVVTSVF